MHLQDTEARTAFISNGLTVGGAERFTLNLVNALARRGRNPILILLSDNNPLLHELDENIQYFIVSRRFTYDVSASWKIKAILRKMHVRKVFCVESFPLFMGRLALLFDAGITFYVSLHNSLPISKGQRLRDIVYMSFFRKRTDVALFICRYQMECFRKYYYFSPDRHFVIYNGTDTNRYRYPDPAYDQGTLPAWKKELGLDKDARTILMVGRISVEKAHTDAIRALKVLHDRLRVFAHLVIVGGGDAQLLAAAKTLVEQEGLSAYVHFMGSHSDVRPFLHHASLFTLTSFSETFSLAALEALGCGLPVSLTNVGGAAEMVTRQNIGELSEKHNPESIANSWFKILEGTYDREAIARFTHDHFSLEKMIQQYDDILSDSHKRQPRKDTAKQIVTI